MISASCLRILQAMSNNPINARLIEAGAPRSPTAAGTGRARGGAQDPHLSLQEPDPTASPARLPSQAAEAVQRRCRRRCRRRAAGVAAGDLCLDLARVPAADASQRGEAPRDCRTSARRSRRRDGVQRCQSDERLQGRAERDRGGHLGLRNLAAGEDTNSSIVSQVRARRPSIR